MAGAVILLIILVLALVSVFLMIRLRRPNVDQFREQIPGALIKLHRGETHYQWSGPENGPVMVCIHGLSTPSFVFDELRPYLHQIGYRVLSYDLYGRGHSDRVAGRQTGAFFSDQLQELLEALGVTGGINILGYSMGGAIAADFVSKQPNRVENLVLIAPAGFDCALGGFADFVTKAPVLGDWLQEVLGLPVFRHMVREEQGTDPVALAMCERMIEEAGKYGSLAAMLSAQRGILREDLRPAHQIIADAPVTTLAIWGRGDTVIPITSMGKLAQINRAAIQVEIEDGNHALPYSYPASVAEAIEDNL